MSKPRTAYRPRHAATPQAAAERDRVDFDRAYSIAGVELGELLLSQRLDVLRETTAA